MDTKKLVNSEDKVWQPILAQMQANIVKHHGRENAYHIFFQFDEKRKEEIKKWIKNLDITSALTQLVDTKKYKELKQKLEKEKLDDEDQKVFDDLTVKTINLFFLSNSGYQAMGIQNPKLTDKSFTAGMQKSKDVLQDTDVSNWDLLVGTKQRIDAMLIVAGDNLLAIQQLLKEKEISANKSGIKILQVEKGKILRNENGLGIEHFGYVDGVSQPLFTNEADAGSAWNDLADIKKVALVNDEAADINAYGSYFVFRKLEQNVKGFKGAEENLGLGEIGGAYVVGRFENGTPVIKHAADIPVISEERLDNNFNYKNDPEGSKCPFHSHIRAVNNRDDSRKAADKIRIVRRGIPYDNAGRGNNLAWHPKDKVGLLFMCYGATIVGQFEKMQIDWANNGDQKPTRIAIDGVIGQGNRTNPLQEYPLKWGEDARVTKCNLNGFVTMQGGEYFFAPSIAFLENLQ